MQVFLSSAYLRAGEMTNKQDGEIGTNEGSEFSAIGFSK